MCIIFCFVSFTTISLRSGWMGTHQSSPRASPCACRVTEFQNHWGWKTSPTLSPTWDPSPLCQSSECHVLGHLQGWGPPATLNICPNVKQSLQLEDLRFRGNSSWCPSWSPLPSPARGAELQQTLSLGVINPQVITSSSRSQAAAPGIVSHLYGAHPPSCCSPAVRWHLRKIKIKGRNKVYVVLVQPGKQLLIAAVHMSPSSDCALALKEMLCRWKRDVYYLGSFFFPQRRIICFCAGKKKKRKKTTVIQRISPLRRILSGFPLFFLLLLSALLLVLEALAARN